MNVVATSQVPTTLPVLPGVAVAGRYVIAGRGDVRGGRAMDAWAVPGGRVALAVTGVVGGGPEGDCGVAELQAVLRERLGAGVGLREAIDSLDRYAAGRPSLGVATVGAAVVDLDDGALEWVAAGHTPPMVAGHAGGSDLLPGPGNRPLGTGTQRIASHRALLQRDDVICLFGGGLPSRKGGTRARGINGLRRAADAAMAGLSSSSRSAGADEFCDRLLRHVPGEHAGDEDAALLALRRTALPSPFALHCPAVPRVLPEIRHRINGWLDDLGVGLVDHVGLGHAVVELAANVVQHAYVDGRDPAPDVVVEASLRDDGTVCIRVGDRGVWRQGEVGHGLTMVSGLVEHMTMTRSARGTSVELSQHLTRSVPMLRAVGQPSSASGPPVVDDEAVELSVDSEPGRLVARGPVDDLSVEILRAALVRASCGGTADAVVDLGGLTQLDPVGVQLLFEFDERCARTGSRLRLRAPSGSLAFEQLALAGLVDGA